MSMLSTRLERLLARPAVLRQSLRGIEKEGLRVDQVGLLSMKAHPLALGSALTHPRVFH